MQIGSSLEFLCVQCKDAIVFSVLHSEKYKAPITCGNCKKQYLFDDATILKDLKKFEALCQQIHFSRDILGISSVAVNISSHEVKIPYKILLTRLNSTIDLKFEDKSISIRFRIEPIKDFEEVLSQK